MSDEYDPIPETVNNALAQWDAGETVFTVEMGGLGPGYEMAIQGLAFELMREFRGQPRYWEVPWEQVADEDKKMLEAIRDAVVKKCNSKPWGGFSGAQVGAAASMAANVCRRGYRAALRDPAIQDRLIQVSKLDLRGAALEHEEAKNG